MPAKKKTASEGPQWPADKVERWPIGKLTPYANNPRLHPEEQILQIINSIKEWGWTTPILVDEKGGIIAGHGRVMAAERLGILDVPVMIARGWSESQKRAYVIADNQIPANAGWDEAMLRVELGALAKLDYDLGLTGFDDVRLATFVGGLPSNANPDEEQEEPEGVAVSKLGDVWLLGGHRIICGDCTDEKTVSKLLGTDKPHLMVTDPPYGVEYDASWRIEAGLSGKGAATGKVLNDDRADWREAWALFKGDVAYVWHAGRHCAEVALSLQSCKFEVRQQIIWVKSRFTVGRANYQFQHEPAFYAVRKDAEEHWHFVPEHEVAAYSVRAGKKSHYNGDRTQSTVWNIEHIKSETGHSTQKPVDCMKRPIENNTKRGDFVYEPFSGSGTTIIAAEMTGRICLAIELSPLYVDLAVRRWERFTNSRATLQGTRKTFAAVEKERGSAKGK